MIATAILTVVWNWIVGVVVAFWPWLVAGASAILAFLFSPSIRKYTIAIIAVAAILASVFVWGYNSNHTVTTLPCTEYSKPLTTGVATDKIIKYYKRNGLCT